MTEPNSPRAELPAGWRATRWLRWAAGAALLAAAAMAQALSTDRDQKINIDADFCGYEEMEGTAICTGNVIVTQGSIRMTGDRLRMYRGDDKQLDRAVLEGQPATFQQRADDNRNDLSGRARTIELYEQRNLLILIEQAHATRGDETIDAYRIEYDTEQNRITAHAGADGAVQSGERVRVVWPPSKRQEEP
ncbi:MAG: lipopolysaccharide transport periplasmic protein LptA [Gammaproteobacteria bacterium]|nr:lipopolysaccharide transport periplasmic protein LptA [Gammaproteobacteria bacterium]